jgi:acetyl-CoA carboxylase carboxyltransferase component
VIANQPMVLAGSVDADAADKAAHFIDVADAFHLPLVFLADNPGMLPGSASERAGVLRSGARMFAAQTRARVPKVHLTLRKAYGFGSMVMSLPAFDGQAATFGYPGATLGAMGASAFAESLGSDAEESERLRRLETDASLRSAERFGFDELIDPVDTRRHIAGALSLALNRRQVGATPRQTSAVMP